MNTPYREIDKCNSFDNFWILKVIHSPETEVLQSYFEKIREITLRSKSTISGVL